MARFEKSRCNISGGPGGKRRSRVAAGRSCNQEQKGFCVTHIPPWL